MKKGTKMKKLTALGMILAIISLLLTGCGKKTFTIEDFAGKWKIEQASSYDQENLANFLKAAKMFGIEGGIVINGDRITVARNLEYDMLYTDFCTFRLEDGKMIVHDLEVQDFMPIGDFEADFKLEDNKLTLTEGTTTIVFEKYDEQ